MTTYPTTPRVKALTGTRKKNFFFSTTITPQSVNSYWDGGSKSNYAVYNIQTGIYSTPSQNSSTTFPKFTDHTYQLQPFEILIETGVFMGKPATPQIICREEDKINVMAYLNILT